VDHEIPQELNESGVVAVSSEKFLLECRFAAKMLGWKIDGLESVLSFPLVRLPTKPDLHYSR